MAENQEQIKPMEREIPVFTVLKNNSILKNIFVLDNPPPISSTSSALGSGNGNQELEIEEVLLVGRHPDCNIKLEHPSISRFHLRIHSKPSSRSLFVTDLSSVHGTCVSGKRIEPGVKVELVQGDTLKLGESSRLYRLDWVPISFAYNINDSFVPQMDSLDSVEEETEGATDQDENSLPHENEWEHFLSDKMEGVGLSWQEMAKEAPMPADLCRTFPENDEVEKSHVHNKGNETLQLDTLDTVNEEMEGAIDQVQDENSLPRENEWGQCLSVKMEGLGMSIQEMEKQAPMPGDLYHTFPEKDEVNGHLHSKGNETTSSHLCTLDVSFTLDDVTNVTKNQDGDSSLHRNDDGLGWQFLEDLGLSMQENDFYHSSPEKYEVENNLSPDICNKENDMYPFEAPLAVDGEAEGVTNQDGDNLLHLNDEGLGHEQPSCDKNISVSMQKMNTTIHALPEYEVENTSLLETCEKENEFPTEMNSQKRVALNIWSRRGKSESVKVETNRSKANCARIEMSSLVKPLDEDCENIPMLKDEYSSPDKDNEIFTPDKENASLSLRLVKSLGSRFDEALKSSSMSNTTISCVDADDETFTPDKENMTPNSYQHRSFKNVGSSQEVIQSNLHKQSPLKTVSHSIYREEVMLPIPRQRTILQELTSTSSPSKSHGRLRKQPNALKLEKRVPFLPLPLTSNSDDKSASMPSVHSECEGVNHSHRWTIVVDTSCLLNKKSRRELQLLRGLRGTSLVIPRIVLRELDCMVRRASFLSRMTEASAALQWIEECMASTKWWIHVQSSSEESWLIPPTPPASASAHWLCEDRGPFSVSHIPFSPYTLQEIITPTATDHILDSALFFKKTKIGQFVLLSEDVTLKIKAMAEGVICETAKEFRASLVNPFSARFLYSASSPRGPTWTCLDDTVLKEQYYPSPSKKTARSGEGAKGLKLILMHNSNFRQLRA